MSEGGVMHSSPGEGGGLRGSVSRLNVLIAGTAAIIGIIYGYDLGSIASAILFLKPDLGLSTFMVSAVTATVVLGQLVGAFNAGRITNRPGPGDQGPSARGDPALLVQRRQVAGRG